MKNENHILILTHTFKRIPLLKQNNFNERKRRKLIYMNLTFSKEPHPHYFQSMSQLDCDVNSRRTSLAYTNTLSPFKPFCCCDFIVPLIPTHTVHTIHFIVIKTAHTI